MNWLSIEREKSKFPFLKNALTPNRQHRHLLVVDINIGSLDTFSWHTALTCYYLSFINPGINLIANCISALLLSEPLFDNQFINSRLCFLNRG